MKKEYIAPEQSVVVLQSTNMMLTGSNMEVYHEEVDEETTWEKYGESEGTAW